MEAAEKRRIALENLAKGRQQVADQRKAEREKLLQELKTPIAPPIEEIPLFPQEIPIPDPEPEISLKRPRSHPIRPYRYWFEQDDDAPPPKKPKIEPEEEVVPKELPPTPPVDLAPAPSLSFEMASSALKVVTALALFVVSAAAANQSQRIQGSGVVTTPRAKPSGDLSLYMRE
jgi:hypothetical protein